ncbi:MAG: hypothetical protein LC104_11790 [Bacteroidales bacterium]|nr:hypothetical protein [Bacteroidales bacterium]
MDPIRSGEQYLIVQGVHRSVAAREAGLSGILTQIESNGRKIRLTVLPFDQLLSPKAAIGRWDRGRDFWTLVALMQTVAGRARIPAVIVNPVPEVVWYRFTPLTDVAVLDETEEERP